MKVGTDGVLLGAWCDCSHAKRALDIGTGTGLIALMLAQRNTAVSITAIEPNDQAAADADLNFNNSPWNDRITLMMISINDFFTEVKYDLIVANPPFFKNSLPAPDKNRNLARHIGTFNPATFAATSQMLHQDGILAGIYPLDIFEEFNGEARKNGLFLSRICEVSATPLKSPHRVLFEYTFAERPTPTLQKMVIEENGRHGYSEMYKKLTSDFYLNF